jgi:large subunit ribosomal protein L3
MSLGLVGRKVGMTRIFAEDGASVPVTVLDVSNNRVTQVKTPEVDGYAAVQVTFGQRRASRVSKPLAGHMAKAGVEAGHVLKEFRIEADQLASFKAGDQVAVTIFAEGQKVDVSGTSIGKGAPQLQLKPCVPWQLGFAQCAGFHRHGAGPGSCFPGQANGRPSR